MSPTCTAAHMLLLAATHSLQGKHQMIDASALFSPFPAQAAPLPYFSLEHTVLKSPHEERRKNFPPITNFFFCWWTSLLLSLLSESHQVAERRKSIPQERKYSSSRYVLFLFFSFFFSCFSAPTKILSSFDGVPFLRRKMAAIARSNVQQSWIRAHIFVSLFFCAVNDEPELLPGRGWSHGFFYCLHALASVTILFVAYICCMRGQQQIRGHLRRLCATRPTRCDSDFDSTFILRPG